MEHKKKIKLDYWKIATIVLAVLFIVSIFSSGFRFDLSKNKIAQDTITFINENLLSGQTAKLVGVTKENGLYKITLEIAGKEFPSYVTKDGQFLFPQAIDMKEVINTSAAQTQETPAQEIPKTEKPVADFFVFSYCPYGTQMEKVLVPVYNLLKNKADINLVFIGAMHGEYEHVESLRQLCIQKIYGKDKLFSYLDKFLVNAAIGTCQGTDTCVNPLIEVIYTQIGMDKEKINTCMTTDAEALYTLNEQQASQLGIGSSPTVTINGVEAQVGRSPALVQEAICSAFSTTPTECSQKLSATAASAGFGSTASSGSTASCG